MVNSKECTRCLRDLPESEFYKRDASKDGLQPVCRKCSVELSLKRRVCRPVGNFQKGVKNEHVSDCEV